MINYRYTVSFIGMLQQLVRDGRYGRQQLVRYGLQQFVRNGRCGRWHWVNGQRLISNRFTAQIHHTAHPINNPIDDCNTQLSGSFSFSERRGLYTKAFPQLVTLEILFDSLRKNTCFHSFLVNYFFNNNLVCLAFCQPLKHDLAAVRLTIMLVLDKNAHWYATRPFKNIPRGWNTINLKTRILRAPFILKQKVKTAPGAFNLKAPLFWTRPTVVHW